MTVPSLPEAIALVMMASVALWGCEGDQTEVVGLDPIVPQLAKPCLTDPSHPSCPDDGSGNDREGTMDLTGGLIVSDAPVIVESDLATKIKAFTDSEAMVQYNLLTTRDKILADECPIVHGRNVSDGDAQDIAHTLANDLDDTQTTTRVVAAADWTDGGGTLFTGYTSVLGPVRVRVTDSSSFPENGAPTATLLSDDGTTATWVYTGGTFLVWLNLHKHDAVKIGCPNEESIEVTLHR